MSSLPPPVGHPATTTPASDPWAEQVRRQAAHREQTRRRRRRWLHPVVALAILVAGACVAYALNDRLADSRSDDPSVGVVVTPSTDPASTGSESTLPPDRLVAVDLVWLVDRGDGTFDWGVSVRTPAIAPTRSGVVIEVWLTDSAGGIVHRASGVVDGIGPDSTGAVTGRLTSPERDPVRIEFDVEVGVASNDSGISQQLSVRAIERTRDSVSGRIASASTEPIENITMVLLWFDGDGEVVAAVPQAVDRIRPDVEVRFDIDLSDEAVPDGDPDSVVWAP